MLSVSQLLIAFKPCDVSRTLIPQVTERHATVEDVRMKEERTIIKLQEEVHTQSMNVSLCD